MNEKTKTGLEILQSAILLGIMGDLLLRQTPWGLNVFLWIGLLVTAMIALTLRRKREHWTTQTIALHGALVFFSLMYVWRDSMELKTLNFFAILSILALLTLPVLKLKTHATGVFHYGIAAIYTGVSSALAPFLLVIEDIEWKSVPDNGWSKHLVSVVRGLAIAIPILFVFGVLFMAADAVFEGIVQNTFQGNPDFLIGHAIAIGFIAWFVAGYLRASMFDLSTVTKTTLVKPIPDTKKQVASVTTHISEDALKEAKPPEEETPIDRLEAEAKFRDEMKKRHPEPEKKEESSWNWRNFDNRILPKFLTLGVIETSIILGLMNLLFLSFVIIQVPYLFGGMDLVQSTPDFKLADYARRGFEELVMVSALVLPILLLSHWLLRKDKPINEKIFRVFAGVQIALLFVIMASATQRLLLLTGNLGYGLTTVRFYPMAFMFFLALVFAWFGLTVLRGMRQQFAWGTLWIGLFVLGTLHVMNPDDFIARTNINLMKQGRSFDASYNANLSDDAIPTLIDSMDLMTLEQSCTIKRSLFYRLDETMEETDFRTWNYSRWIAKQRLFQDFGLLEKQGCPTHDPSFSEF